MQILSMDAKVTIERSRVALGLLVGAFVISGCGGGSGESSGAKGVVQPSEVFYTVTTQANQGGTVSPSSQQVKNGATTTVQVDPSQGYRIASVSGCAGSLNGTTYTTGAITAACTINAEFAAVAVAVSVQTSVEGSGRISPTEFSGPAGSDVSFSLTPAEGFGVYAVSGCEGTVSGNVFRIANLTKPCQLKVTFKAKLATPQLSSLGSQTYRGELLAVFPAGNEICQFGEALVYVADSPGITRENIKDKNGFKVNLGRCQGYVDIKGLADNKTYYVRVEHQSGLLTSDLSEEYSAATDIYETFTSSTVFADLKAQLGTMFFSDRHQVVSRNGLNLFVAVEPRESDGGALVALADDGQLSWIYKTETGIRTSPVVDDNRNMYFTTQDGTLHALNVRGDLIWKAALKGVGSNIVLKNNRLYVASAGNVEIHTLAGVKTMEVGTGAWSEITCVTEAGDFYVASQSEGLTLFRSSGSKVWSNPAMYRSKGCPTSDGLLFATPTYPQLHMIAAKAESGQTLWSQKLQSNDGGDFLNINNSLIAVNGNALYRLQPATGNIIEQIDFSKGTLKPRGASPQRLLVDQDQTLYVDARFIPLTQTLSASQTQKTALFAVNAQNFSVAGRQLVVSTMDANKPIKHEWIVGLHSRGGIFAATEDNKIVLKRP